MSHVTRSVLLTAAVVFTAQVAARAQDITPPRLSLDPSVIRADQATAAATAPSTEPAESAESPGLLMQGLGTLGVGKPLADNNTKIYGWVEAGYTFLHRHHGDELIVPGPFNHEFGNHLMLNQFVLRFEKEVDASKGQFDVGGLLELLYGSDAAQMHSTGLGFNGSDPTDDGVPNDPDSATVVGGSPLITNARPIWQFDIPQAYVDLAIPVANGLTLRIGKFVSLLGYENTDPRDNLFYSHSYLFFATPYTQTGVIGFYKLNDQWKVAAGISRGWEITLEDVNGSAIDALGQIVYTPDDKWTFTLNWNTGPENAHDSSHYRTVIDPYIEWQATEKFYFALEAFYLYDGGVNGSLNGGTHGYGDVWGAAFYAQYEINDMFTANARFEKAHTYLADFAGLDTSTLASGVPTINAYEITLGLTIKPFPGDPVGKNLSVRPEIRYDFAEDHVFSVHGGTETFKDQLTFGADLIFTF